MSKLDTHLSDNREKFESELFELLRIPSVSTDSKYKEETRLAGQWVAEQFRTAGLTTRLIETKGHPIIFAESEPVEGAVTALVYGHYDVQPPDPIDEWTSPPFEPTVNDGNVVARGATDDKGQMFTHIKSVQAWIDALGRLPIQVKFLIEGEEECGSHALMELMEGEYDDSDWNAIDKLKCDVCVVSDSSQFGPGQPAITYGLRGISYFELRLKGPRQDLHSGTFGGAVANPLNALTRIMSALIDERGKIQVPGFYDDVVPLTDRERQQFADLPFYDSGFMRKIGVDAVAGEESYSTLERRWARPTFDINGIWGGYQGEGAKTVLPAKAGAKFSFRLVPSQDPQKIAQSVRQLVEETCPPGIEMELLEFQGGKGIVFSLDSPYVKAAVQAIEQGFGRCPVFIREGGSIPIITTFSEKLGVDSLLLGWGLDDDNTHSPNEKFSLTDFHRGIKASAYLWKELAQIVKE